MELIFRFDVSELEKALEAAVKRGVSTLRAFVGSQSLRKLELDGRREVGIIVRESKVVKRIVPAVLPPLRDRIRPGVRVLFVGINPGIRSSLTGHHFAGFSNRFWKLLYESRLVPEPIGCEDDDRLPEWGYGVTNIVARPTPGIDTLRPEEYVAGRARLRRKIGRHKPAVVAAVGVTVFRALFPERRGVVAPGIQPERIGGSAIFVLPNPSGRNANFSYAEMLAAYRSLAQFVSQSTLR